MIPFMKAGPVLFLGKYSYLFVKSGTALFFRGTPLALLEEKKLKKRAVSFIFYEEKRPKKTNGLLYFSGG
jgi:hypothetical protein